VAVRESARPSIFWIMGPVALAFLGLSMRFRVHKVENLPQRGAFVLAPNHYSEIDPIIVGLVLWKNGRNPHFLAKASLFRVPVLGFFMRKSGQIPVERTAASAAKAVSPFAGARALVENEHGVIVYPEGTLTRDPEMWPMRGKTGAARIALEQGIPVIPLATWGIQSLMGRYAKKINLFRVNRMDFLFGEPVDLSEFRGRPIDQDVLNSATEKIMQSITGLLEELRGEKAPAERWDPAAKGQRETGRDFES